MSFIFLRLSLNIVQGISLCLIERLVLVECCKFGVLDVLQFALGLLLELVGERDHKVLLPEQELRDQR